eukprot:329958-Rhodomonas_salina.1
MYEEGHYMYLHGKCTGESHYSLRSKDFTDFLANPLSTRAGRAGEGGKWAKPLRWALVRGH